MNKLVAYVIALLASVMMMLGSPMASAAPDCSGDALISETFANGAKWEMCWESRIRENLVLSDVYYTAPNATATKVLGSARLSQLHVAYDDSDVTYNDVTQYGLGGGYLVELTDTDCPFGDLLIVQTRPTICKWRSKGNDNYRTPTRSVSAESLTLFSVSQVGAYAYIVTWKFYSDGAMAPEIGATGALQRSSDDIELPFGRVLEGDNDTLWLSHTHNYYWRLDFDLGISAIDDVVTESRIELAANGQRQTRVERFGNEQARTVSEDHPVSWEIWDSLKTDTPTADDKGYRIEPIHFGHRLDRREIEPYTEYDFFVTVANDCERFASQNARFNPDCLNQVAQFVNGESLVDADLAVWHRVSFHHVPRNEDQRHMHTHWDGFTMEPINLQSSTPGININDNSAPTIAMIENQSSSIGAPVDLQLNANDSDGDGVSFSAQNLPDGLFISDAGLIQGSANSAGTFNVTITATDDIADARREFSWTVGNGNASGSTKTGGDFFGSAGPWLIFGLAVAFVQRLNRRRRIVAN